MRIATKVVHLPLTIFLALHTHEKLGMHRVGQSSECVFPSWPECFSSGTEQS